MSAAASTNPVVWLDLERLDDAGGAGSSLGRLELVCPGICLEPLDPAGLLIVEPCCLCCSVSVGVRDPTQKSLWGGGSVGLF